MHISMFPLLAVVLHCQSFQHFQMTCSSCQQGPGCVYFAGGPFNNSIIISDTCSQFQSDIQNISSTTQDFSFPIKMTVSCGLVCSGCGFTLSYVNISSTTGAMIGQSGCGDTNAGQSLESLFNFFYGICQGNAEATYDWCNLPDCSYSPTNLIITLGIVLGTIGLTIVVGIICYCLRLRRNEGFYVSGFEENTTKTIEM